MTNRRLTSRCGTWFPAVLISFAALAPSFAHGTEPLRVFTSTANVASAETFGWSIALDGNYLYVGDPYDRTLGPERGSVQGFEIDSGAHLFTASAPGIYGHYGYDIDAKGGRVLIGARTKSVNGGEDGKAYLLDGTSGQQLYEVVSPDPHETGHFATRVDLGTETFLVSEGQYGGVGGEGRSHLFDVQTGAPLHSFHQPPSSGDRSQFGYGMALWNDRVLLSNTREQAVFSFDAFTGDLLQTYAAPAAAQPATWANPIVAYGDDFFVGDYLSPLSGEGTGAVHLIDGSTGEIVQSFVSDDPQLSSLYGYSICAVGDYLLIGAPQEHNQFFGSLGFAYFYRISTGELLQKFTPPANVYQENFGWDVKLHNGYAFVSGPTADTGERLDGPGSVYMFAVVPEPSSIALLIIAVASSTRLRVRFNRTTKSTAPRRDCGPR